VCSLFIVCIRVTFFSGQKYSLCPRKPDEASERPGVPTKGDQWLNVRDLNHWHLHRLVCLSENLSRREGAHGTNYPQVRTTKIHINNYKWCQHSPCIIYTVVILFPQYVHRLWHHACRIDLTLELCSYWTLVASASRINCFVNSKLIQGRTKPEVHSTTEASDCWGQEGERGRSIG